jgi:hypothetical protein
VCDLQAPAALLRGDSPLWAAELACSLWIGAILSPYWESNPGSSSPTDYIAPATVFKVLASEYSLQGKRYLGRPCEDGLIEGLHARGWSLL